jgi:hypothetical protein
MPQVGRRLWRICWGQEGPGSGIKGKWMGLPSIEMHDELRKSHVDISMASALPSTGA